MTYNSNEYLTDASGIRFYKEDVYQKKEMLKMYQQTLVAMDRCAKERRRKQLYIEHVLARNDPLKVKDEDSALLQISCWKDTVSNGVRIQFRGNLITFDRNEFVIDKQSDQFQRIESLLKEIYSVLQREDSVTSEPPKVERPSSNLKCITFVERPEYFTPLEHCEPDVADVQNKEIQGNSKNILENALLKQSESELSKHEAEIESWSYTKGSSSENLSSKTSVQKFRARFERKYKTPLTGRQCELRLMKTGSTVAYKRSKSNRKFPSKSNVGNIPVKTSNIPVRVDNPKSVNRLRSARRLQNIDSNDNKTI